MAKRVKPVLNIPAVTTLEEADATLAQIAARKRELALLELGLKEDVDTLKLKCAEASEPIKQDIEVLEQALIRFGKSKKEPTGVAGGSSCAPVRLCSQLRPNRRISIWHLHVCYLRPVNGLPAMESKVAYQLCLLPVVSLCNPLSFPYSFLPCPHSSHGTKIRDCGI